MKTNGPVNAEIFTPGARRRVWLVTALLGLLLVPLTGCLSVSEGSAAMKQQALSFTPPPGKAFIYVIRPDRFVGQNLYFEVNLDMEMFGRLANRSFLFAAVPPGEHALQGSYQQPLLLGGSEKKVGRLLGFTAEAGRNYFFTLNYPAFMGGPGLEQISESEGQAAVRQSTLSGENRFEYQHQTGP
jgi:hypothetical protein